MGFGGSADIFQAQIIDLMASLKLVRAYMDDLLIIMKGILDKHLQKMETVLNRLHDARLKSMQLSHHSVHTKLNTLIIYWLGMESNLN
jgi:hypothetical protein